MSDTAPTPARQKRKMSAGAKFLVVIAAITGIIVFAGILAVIAGMWWAFRPGDQKPTAVAVGPETTGVVHVTLDPEDPAVGELTVTAGKALMGAYQKSSDARLPAPLRGLRKIQGGMTDPSFMVKMFPRELTVALAPPKERGEDTPVHLAMNLRGFSGVLELVFRALVKDQRQARMHRGHRIVEINKGAVGLLGATVLFADDVESVAALIDRIEDGKAPASLPERFLQQRDRFAPKPEVYAHLDNAAGDAARLLGAWLGDDEQRFAGVRHVTFAIDLATADQLQGNLVAECADEATVTTLDASFARAETRARERLAGDGMSLSSSREKKGRELEVRFEVSGLLGAVRTISERM